MTTWRSTLFLQLPHERYSLPKSMTVKPSIVTVPAPLCWITLSEAPWAPPPETVPSPSPFRERASCQVVSILNCVFYGIWELTLAHGNPPHVLDCARPLAVHALDLIRADNSVLERRAVLEDENGVRITALVLAGALDATAVGLHATVEGAGDGFGCIVGDGALGCGNGQRGALQEVEEVFRGLGRRRRSGGGGKSQDGSSD